MRLLSSLEAQDGVTKENTERVLSIRGFMVSGVSVILPDLSTDNKGWPFFEPDRERLGSVRDEGMCIIETGLSGRVAGSIKVLDRVMPLSIMEGL